MDEFNAWKAFQAATGAPTSSEDEYRRMLKSETDFIARTTPRIKHEDAIETAARRMLLWWDTSAEVKGSPAYIVARHHTAAAWAILAAREHAGEQQPKP